MNQQTRVPLRVLHIASGDLWAGAEVQIYYLAKSLQQLPFIDLQVVLLNDLTLAEKLRANGITVTILDENRLSSLQILWRLNQQINQFQPHIVHTHRQKENVLGSLATIFNLDVVCLRTQHGAEEHPPGILQLHKHLFQLLDKLAGRHIQEAIIAVSQELGKQLARVYGKHKVHVITNGIDLQEIQARAGESDPALPHHAGHLKIGVFARLVPVKRLDIAIASLQQLQLQNIPADLFVFGDGPLRQKLEAQAANLGVQSQVIFMGHQENGYAYMKQMDCLLITSDHEGLPLNLLEALCLKVPVVAHAVGGIPEVLGQGKYGCLVRQQAPPAYAQQIAELMAREDLPAFTAAAFRHCQQEYSIEKTCGRVVALYQDLIVINARNNR